MADPSCSAFDPSQPPLLKTCGFGFIARHKRVSSTVEEFTIELDARQVLSRNEALAKTLDSLILSNPVTGKLTRERFWQLSDGPMKLTSTQQLTKTFVFTSTVRQLEELRASLSATVGGAFGPVSAEVTASLEAGIQQETTMQLESGEERHVTLKGGKVYAFWELMETLSVSYDRYSFEINMGKLGNLPGIYQPDPVTASSVLGLFQDEARFDELPEEPLG